MDRFIDSMLPLISTATGKALADAALAVQPSAWWTDFAGRFGTPAAADQPNSAQHRRSS